VEHRPPRSVALIARIRNCDFPFQPAALTMDIMSRSRSGEVMSNERSTKASAISRWIERLFEGLERAKLKDLERSIARAANEREVSQRVHRLEAGEAPLH
jgi:hypothetical protein